MEKIHRIWFSRIPYEHFQQIVDQITRPSAQATNESKDANHRAIIWDVYRHEIRWFSSSLAVFTPATTSPVGYVGYQQFDKQHYLDPQKQIALTLLRDKIHQL